MVAASHNMDKQTARDKLAQDKLAQIRAVAAQVPDPELPMLTIADLGILRDVKHTPEGDYIVELTPSYIGCPATDMIMAQTRQALDEAGLSDVKVKRVLHPVWTTDWITQEGRAKMRAHGIAPPQKRQKKKPTALFATPAIDCPHCHAKQSERISEFGSTPCKALYKCLVCLEPFEYFKCH